MMPMAVVERRSYSSFCTLKDHVWADHIGDALAHQNWQEWRPRFEEVPGSCRFLDFLGSGYCPRASRPSSKMLSRNWNWNRCTGLSGWFHSGYGVVVVQITLRRAPARCPWPNLPAGLEVGREVRDENELDVFVLDRRAHRFLQERLLVILDMMPERLAVCA